MTITLPNDFQFEERPRDNSYLDPNNKHQYIPKDVNTCLANPTEHRRVRPGKNRIFLGYSSANGQDNERWPLSIPVDIFDKHILIAGGIGSGKTVLLSRLIAGAIKDYGTVVISEAKTGRLGSDEGAAFTELSQYIKIKFPAINLMRWPKGNYYFNPLQYCRNIQDINTLFNSFSHLIQSQQKISGDLLGFVFNAMNIAKNIVDYLKYCYPNECTFRNLIKYLKNYKIIQEDIKNNLQKIELVLQTSLPENERISLEFTKNKLSDINNQLQRLNFFYLDNPDLVMSRNGVSLLINLLDHEDLLYYTEAHQELQELKIDDILYRRSLVVISQPLYDPASAIVGPLFYNSLLNKVIELGPDPAPHQGTPRQKVAVFLDETHRLPVGRLGESGDFLREYKVGLVEVTPAIIDQERWQSNKHVYQTLISLSPGVPEAVELMRERLPNIFPNQTKISSSIGSKGMSNIKADVMNKSEYQYLLGEDNPGVSNRSLRMTGRFTGLLQSIYLDNKGQVFWIDFEDELLANLKTLFKAAQSSASLEKKKEFYRAIDYALGWRLNYSQFT